MMNGRSFKACAATLGEEGKRLFREHGNQTSGREAFIEQIIEDAMVRSQIAPNAVVAQNPDFLALARAYGAKACAPQTLAELQEAVGDAFKADGPTVIRMTAALAE